MGGGRGQKGVIFDTLRICVYRSGMQLILASSSPYRKAQLESFGMQFQAVKPLVDEAELKLKGPEDLVELTRFLAGQKAESLRAQFPGAILLGSDQLVELEGARLDKPGNHAGAANQLARLQGKTHRLLTSLSVRAPHASYVFTDITRVTLRPLTPAQIEAYLRQDQPYDCAGSYKIERAGLALVARVETQDPSAIQGLPLISLSEGLQKLNIPWMEWWSTK